MVAENPIAASNSDVVLDKAIDRKESGPTGILYNTEQSKTSPSNPNEKFLADALRAILSPNPQANRCAPLSFIGFGRLQ